MAERSWYLPRKPGEIGAVPWLHPSAVEYLAGLVGPDMRVLEHGAGGSTLWFAERVQAVVTVEHNPAWAEQVRAAAPANVTILTALPELEAHPAYDLMLIDGERMERGKCLLLAHKFVRPGGWVVLDNSNRPEYAKEREILAKHAKLHARFDNNIPRSHYFVTEFWQCE